MIKDGRECEMLESLRALPSIPNQGLKSLTDHAVNIPTLFCSVRYPITAHINEEHRSATSLLDMTFEHPHIKIGTRSQSIPHPRVRIRPRRCRPDTAPNSSSDALPVR